MWLMGVVWTWESAPTYLMEIIIDLIYETDLTVLADRESLLSFADPTLVFCLHTVVYDRVTLVALWQQHGRQNTRALLCVFVFVQCLQLLAAQSFYFITKEEY